MSATWSATNTGPGTGQYTLNESNTPTAYQAMTVDMTTGADYSTNEIMDAVVGASCAALTPFALIGYTSGDTLAEAQAATPTMTVPTFTNLTNDKFVIVWNDDCATAENNGNIGGNVVSGPGVLAVTSVELTDTSATADGTFASGWKYTFNITVPTNETGVAMKFSDWARTGGGGTIPTANNVRISSAQANNAGATILVTAANTYTTPNLTMTGDLDPLMDGLQVKVVVEVAVPVGTPSGAYTTTYGVQSQP